ncbi:peptidoglycan DD-metalloendopeptidase family protein [Megalodesulfovibrio paquesii]
MSSPQAPLDTSLATSLTSTLSSSLASADHADMLARRRQVDQIRHEIAGGDEAAARRKDAKLREACQGFESIFLNKIWSQMRQSLPKEGYLHSKEEEFYQQMFDKELMDKMSRNGGIGLGDMLYQHLKESSERASRTTATIGPREPLPLNDKDRHQLRAGLEEVGLVPTEPLAAADPLQAAPSGSSQSGTPGLTQVAYAPYGGVDGQTVTDTPQAQLGNLANPGLPLARPQLKPIPMPHIDLSKPEGKQDSQAGEGSGLASYDPDAPHDASQPTPLDLRAMNPETANTDGLSLGERLARAPVVPPQQAQQMQQTAQAAPGMGMGLPAQAAPPAVNPAQSRAAQAYDKADRSSRTEGRRSSMPPLVDPVSGEISSAYGWRDDPITGKRSWHSGLDIKAPEGSAVNACWDGTVIFAGNGGQYGNTVVLEHTGGWRTFYGHAKDLNVKVGQKVQAGERIASVGQSGRATGPHLHFEIRQGGLAWDPLQVKEHLLAGLDSAKKS